MAQKKSYSRYFIILQEDEKGYSLSSDKVVSGYAKLEMKNEKCKVSFYVQNLKKQMAPYYMILICNKKDVKKVIKISEMNIDEYGRADVSFEYPVANVANSNIAMDKITGAAIVKFLDSNIVPVMSGFASTEIPEWKKFDIVEDKTRHEQERVETEDDPKERIENKIEAKSEEKSIFDKYEEDVEQLANTEKEDSRVEESDIRVEEPESKSDSDSDPVDDDEQNQQVKLTDEEVVNTDNYRIDDEYSKLDEDIEDYPIGTAGKFFRSLVKDHEELHDFCNEIKRCKWYKVPVNCIEDLYDMSNYNKYTVMKYPMINYYPYIEKHGHYIIGYKCNKNGKVKYIVYGVAGTKDKKDQPYGGKSGFVTWVPSKNADKDNFGYWLMFYDFRTSTIVIPVK